MADSKVTTVRLSIGSEKFEILVKPDPALNYKLGKTKEIGSVLVSEEIYLDANKGDRASSEKLLKSFKTTDTTQVAEQILLKGDLSLTTDQRRRMIEEKRKQIVQHIYETFVDPRTHNPHPLVRIDSAIEEARVAIDPFRRSEDQAKTVVDAVRKILPLKSETIALTVIVPASYSAQSYNVIKKIGQSKSEQWLSNGSLKVDLEINAGAKASFLEKLGAATKGSAQVTETV
jgi:ribosome maturation protein SDO1